MSPKAKHAGRKRKASAAPTTAAASTDKKSNTVDAAAVAAYDVKAKADFVRSGKFAAHINRTFGPNAPVADVALEVARFGLMMPMDASASWEFIRDVAVSSSGELPPDYVTWMGRNLGLWDAHLLTRSSDESGVVVVDGTACDALDRAFFYRWVYDTQTPEGKAAAAAELSGYDARAAYRKVAAYPQFAHTMTIFDAHDKGYLMPMHEDASAEFVRIVVGRNEEFAYDSISEQEMVIDSDGTTVRRFNMYAMTFETWLEQNAYIVNAYKQKVGDDYLHQFSDAVPRHAFWSRYRYEVCTRRGRAEAAEREAKRQAVKALVNDAMCASQGFDVNAVSLISSFVYVA